MYYPEEIIDEVIQRNDIVDVISGYVRLTKKGSNYFGLCPFHNEKSASFSVAPAKQLYYCFGCGAGGNVVRFMMEYENESFGEAITDLAARAGITLPKREMTSEDRQKRDMREQLLEVSKKAAMFYYYQMNNSSDGKQALNYLLDRGLSQETIKRFGLGYSPLESDALYHYLRGCGYDDNVLSRSGLFVYKEKKVFDRFWNRVMFPIMDRNSKVIGFGGRVMGQGEPKYLNSPETIIFDKSRNLFGLNEAKHERKEYMLVCEGYMDVISLHQAGFNYSVASLGTALTTQQANLLKRYVKEVILTYDSDGAGIKAALRAIPIMREAGIKTRVLNMKPYKDPDEFIKNLGAEAFQERIDQAVDSFMFEISVIRSGYDMNKPADEIDCYHDIADKLLDFEEELERNSYLNAVCREYFIPVDAMKKMVAERSRTKARKNTASSQNRGEEGESVVIPGKKVKDKNEGIRKSERLMLTWIVNEPEILKIVEEYLGPDDFSTEVCKSVAKSLYEQVHENGAVNPALILNQYMEDEDQYKEAAAIFHSKIADEMETEQKGQILNETVKKILANSLEQRGRQITSAEDVMKLAMEKKKLETLRIQYLE